MELSDFLTFTPYDTFIDLSEMRTQLQEFDDRLSEEVATAIDAGLDVSSEHHHDWDEYEFALQFCDEAEGYGDSAMHEAYLEEHAKELVEDVEGVDTCRWPFCHIDWTAAADELRHDYTFIEWQGEGFYVR